MARSSVMHALKQFAAEHAAARQLALPVSDVRGLSRRALLERAAALGLGTALAAAATTGPARAEALPDGKTPPAGSPRVAVVGAGIAGLTAALTLQDAGIACTVYEANPARVGGRMWTQRDHWAYGQTSEIGGELIDTSHKKILELCRRFNLPTEDFLGGGPNGAEEVLWFDGGYYARAQADEDFKAVYQALRRDLQDAGEVTWNSTTPAGTTLDNMTLYEWIETRVPGGHTSRLGRFIDVAYNVEYGADTVDQSALALVLLMGYQPNPGNFNVWGLSNERYHITGGNDRLPHAIAQALPSGSLLMGRELTAVRANSDGTQTLTFDDSGTLRTVIADHTILCVPLPVLQRIDLTAAGFDPLMRNLLRDARMGYCTKLNMQFTSRPWRGTGPWPGVTAGECFTDSDVQQTWDTTKVQPGNGGILLQYGGGALAGSLTPGTPFATETDPYVRTLAARMLTGIDAFFPGTRAAWNGRAQLSAWHRNPYSLGAYSYWPTGYLHRYARYEGAAQGNVHIGGEHCSYDFQGFMEGGATEGERAAREVITAVL
ncbi:FAD-dependent oxidoreductase [Streptomyces sp. NBC_00536]|uniref:flavin monoamine oxidase family protein n=1 Tax=Streptomyces sp. NBC_00536 TaxID=2975769 RepID=UPI002E8020A8|nr:NAD(P)/FAD-dependent oxidoreductase [Streptomyces sp. NBC_00536]WUC77054.1 FAD-dependent oxidoreductase [Streptomyces sp. NBC_00536]